MIPPCALTGRCWRQFPDRRGNTTVCLTKPGKPASDNLTVPVSHGWRKELIPSVPPYQEGCPMGAPSRPARDRMTAASRLRPLPTRIPASAAILPEACTVRSTMHGVDNLAAEYGTPRPVDHVRPFRRSRSPLSRPFRAKSGMPTQSLPSRPPFLHLHHETETRRDHGGKHPLPVHPPLRAVCMTIPFAFP